MPDPVTIAPVADVKTFPPTGGPMMLLPPDLRRLPQYQLPRPTLLFFPPPRLPSTGPNPIPVPGRRPRPAPRIWLNTEQSCTEECPEGQGDPITVVIPAGSVQSQVSEAAADAAALAQACEEAALLRVLTPCDSGGPEEAAIEFASAERIAALCGFEAYSDPAVPPKKYRLESWTGDLQVQEFPYDENCDGCLPSATGSFEDVTSESLTPYLWSGAWSMVPISQTETTVTYLVTVAVTRTLGGGNPVEFYPSGLSTPAGTIGNGGTFTVLKTDPPWDAAAVVNYIQQQVIGPVECVVGGFHVPFTDTWNIRNRYDRETCVRTDRYQTIRNFPFSVPPWISPTSPIPTTPLLPEVFYQPEFDGFGIQIQPEYISFTETPLQKTTAGLGCVPGLTPGEGLGPKSMEANGSIIQALSEEDTEEDALARATPTSGTSNIAKYYSRLAGEFVFTVVDVAFNIELTGLVIGEDYIVTLGTLVGDYFGGSQVPVILKYGFTATGTTLTISDIIYGVRGTSQAIGTPSIAVAGSTPAGAPTAFTVTPNNALARFELAWTLGGPARDNILVERSLDGVTFVQVASLAGSATSYNDSSIITGLEYTYRVRSITDSVFTLFSNTDSGTVAGPVSVTVGANGLTWTLVFSEAVQFGAGGNGGFVPDMTIGGVLTLAYVSGAGTDTLVFTGSREVSDDEVDNILGYTQPGNGLETLSGEDVASFTIAITNNSALALDDETILWRDIVIDRGGEFETDSISIANNIIEAIQITAFNSSVKYILPYLGSNLAAALTPLRNTPVVGPPVNFFFEESDFSQATGLQGDGQVKYLDLQFTVAALGAGGNGGIAWYENNMDFSGASMCNGSSSNDGLSFFWMILHSSETSNTWGTIANRAVNAVAATNGYYYNQRSSATSRTQSRNGVNIATNTTSDSAPGTGERSLWVMGANNSSGVSIWAGRSALFAATDGTLTPTQDAELYNIFLDNLITPTGR